MICEHYALPKHATEQGQQRRFELRHVNVDDVVPSDAGCRIVREPRHDDAFADLETHRYAYHFDAIEVFTRRQSWGEARRQHRDLVAAAGQPARQPFRVYRQPADMRTIVGERDQDSHPAYRW